MAWRTTLVAEGVLEALNVDEVRPVSRWRSERVMGFLTQAHDELLSSESIGRNRTPF